MKNNPPAVNVSEPTTPVDVPSASKDQQRSSQHYPGMYSDPNGHGRRRYPAPPSHIKEQYVETIVGGEE